MTDEIRQGIELLNPRPAPPESMTLEDQADALVLHLVAATGHPINAQGRSIIYQFLADASRLRPTP